jgi:hypothetical protein
MEHVAISAKSCTANSGLAFLQRKAGNKLFSGHFGM